MRQPQRLAWATTTLLAIVLIGSIVAACRISRVGFSFKPDWRGWTWLWNAEHGVSVHVGARGRGFFRIRAHRWQLGPLLMDIPTRDASLDDEEWAVKEKLVQPSQELAEALDLLNVHEVRPWTACGADLRIRGKSTGITVAMVAANENDLPLLKLALRSGVDPNARSKDGITALHYASGSSNGLYGPEITEALITAGADVNVKGPDGNTPLLSAVGWGNTAVVRVLLAHGADVNARGPNGPPLWNARHRTRELQHVLEAAGGRE